MRRLIPVALLMVAATTFTGCTSERDRLDAEAKRLCSIDGGIKIFEKVTLPREAFYENGLPKLANDKKAEIRWGYQNDFRYTNLKANFNEPTLIRNEDRIVRTSDGKVMATSVVYRRSGGSWWGGLIHGDGYHCPTDEVNTSFYRQVFVQGANQ